MNSEIDWDLFIAEGIGCEEYEGFDEMPDIITNEEEWI